MMGTSYIPDQVISLDEYERRSRIWNYKFSWFPKRCMSTNKTLWLMYAYRGRSKYHHLDQADMWMCKEEYLFERIRGTM